MKPIHPNLEDTINNLKTCFHHTSSLSIRKLQAGTESTLYMSLVYMEGLVNTDKLETHIIEPLLELDDEIERDDSFMDNVSQRIIRTAGTNIANTLEELIDALLDGHTVLLIDGYAKGIIAKTVQMKERSIEQVVSERSPRGGMVGLTEKLDTNIGLLRGMLKTSSFCTESMNIGTISKTAISLLYIQGVVDQDVLSEVKRRIDKLKVNYVLEAKLIEEAMENPYKDFLFTMSETSERPDVITSSLYDGKVVVLVDGNPYGIILPGLFISALHAPDEYNQKLGRFSIRFLRLISFIMTIYIPSVYVVMEKFYSDKLPKNVAETLFKGDELLSPFWSMIILFFLLMVLVDAIFRIPQSAIILVSLLATIAIGETAVSAKIIHPVSLILVSITYLTSLLLASKQMAAPTNTLRFAFLWIGNYFGLPGMLIGTTILLIYMVTLRSVGVPYLAPIIPFRMEQFKDTFFRGRLERVNNSKHSFPNVDGK
ncbi:spore germination protein [Sutcliffiella horikoshii]|uniref:spore germination protein n=1 Tax=Sutcliffiella horikoshii TaxID=79883 RepID=UPI001F1E0BE0|nr:spore germination protein [Sutcliffiella horikoshii]MCG1021452.1 spore germination protein [Sutcliffiella horikoshii]